jgi:hypothetical protein
VPPLLERDKCRLDNGLMITIHMFWWQGCGQALDKGDKPLISLVFRLATL